MTLAAEIMRESEEEWNYALEKGRPAPAAHSPAMPTKPAASPVPLSLPPFAEAERGGPAPRHGVFLTKYGRSFSGSEIAKEYRVGSSSSPSGFYSVRLHTRVPLASG